MANYKEPFIKVTERIIDYPNVEANLYDKYPLKDTVCPRIESGTYVLIKTQKEYTDYYAKQTDWWFDIELYAILSRTAVLVYNIREGIHSTPPAMLKSGNNTLFSAQRKACVYVKIDQYTNCYKEGVNPEEELLAIRLQYDDKDVVLSVQEGVYDNSGALIQYYEDYEDRSSFENFVCPQVGINGAIVPGDNTQGVDALIATLRVSDTIITKYDGIKTVLDEGKYHISMYLPFIGTAGNYTATDGIVNAANNTLAEQNRILVVNQLGDTSAITAQWAKEKTPVGDSQGFGQCLYYYGTDLTKAFSGDIAKRVPVRAYYVISVYSQKNAGLDYKSVFGNNYIVPITRLTSKPTQSQRELMLNEGNYPILTVKERVRDGIYVFNQNYIATTRVNILRTENNRRCCNDIYVDTIDILEQFIGRVNNAETRLQVVSVLEDYLKTRKTGEYGVQQFRVICDETNNTAQVINAEKLAVSVQIRLIDSVKFIEVVNIIVPLGIEFSEVGG